MKALSILGVAAVLAALSGQAHAQEEFRGRCLEINQAAAKIHEGIKAAFEILPPDQEKQGSDGNFAQAFEDIRSTLAKSTVLTAADAESLGDLLSAIAFATQDLYMLEKASEGLKISC